MHYLAYGSNLHPLRLAQRVPNSHFVGTTQLVGYQLAFNKYCSDGSSKCNLMHTQNPADIAFGAVYFIPENEIYLLDEAEGLGVDYFKQQLQVTVCEKSLDVFLYIANDTHLVCDLAPYDWYKALVLSGAVKHNFPANYIAWIEAVKSQPDENKQRCAKMEKLLEQIKIV